MKNIAALILSVFISLGLQAQCKDTVNIQPGAYCPPYFDPVCGCDGKTYKNDCVAHTQNGVLQYNPGPCGAVDFAITPMPVHDIIYLKYYVTNPGTSEPQYLRVQVIDRWGRIFYSNFYQNIIVGQPNDLTIDITEVPYEYCFLLMTTNKGFKVHPFIKFREY